MLRSESASFAAWAVMLLVVVLAWGAWCLAGEGAPGAAQPTSSLWLRALQYLIAHAFGLAILLAFLTALISSYLSRRLSDRCLRALKGFPVTIEFKDGSRDSGILDAENNGIELLYVEPHGREESPPRTSSIVYQAEYNQIQAIICYKDTLSEELQARRWRIIQQLITPPMMRRIWRKVCNFFGAVRDAFSEIFALLLGRLKAGSPYAPLIQTQEKYVSKMGTVFISTVGTASFDPLLEKHIGRRVVIQMSTPKDGVTYLEGVLNDYSRDFLKLHDVLYPERWSIPVPAEDGEMRTRGVVVRREGGQLILSNPLPTTLRIELARVGDSPSSAPLQLSLARGTTEEMELPQTEGGALSLQFEVLRQADLLLPRHSALLRGEKNVVS